MGSPVSPVVANIFMQHMEEEAIETCPYTLRCWRRYVFGVFAIVRKEGTDGILSHLNSFYPTIQFTVEVEDEGKLPFLDDLVRQKEDGRLLTEVYRKKTHRQIPLFPVSPPAVSQERSCSYKYEREPLPPRRCYVTLVI